MKIAIISNYWKNSDGGGIKTYLVNLVTELQRRGIEVKVLFRDGTDPLNFQGGTNKMWFSWSCFNQLLKIRPDVIHSQGAWYCLLPGFLYKKINKCTLIHTFHTEPSEKLPGYAKFFFQRLLNGCDNVTFVSNRLKNRIEEVDGLKFKKTAITYAGAIANAVSNDEIQAFRKKFAIKQDRIVLLASGMTALPYKAQGLKILLQSMVYLKKIYPNVVLIITSKGRYYEELQIFSNELCVMDNVVFTGYLNDPFVPLQLCDIYTHITLGDGLPLALLEAMAIGKPIIATPIAGIPEVIVCGQNGILVEPNEKMIVDKLVLLIENRGLRETMGRNAKMTIQDKFTWEKSADNFIKLYLT